jgi:hypothetical protein
MGLMPWTTPCVVGRLKLPLARIATRPAHSPTRLERAGTPATTLSPVRKPCTLFGRIRYPTGKPDGFTRVRWREPCPVHWTVRVGCAGPTHVADHADAGGVRVGLRDAPSRAVELRSPARPGLDRQTGCLELVEQCPSRRVHCGRVAQRRLGHREDALQALGLLGEELAHILCALRLVARPAGERQVADAIGSVRAPGQDVVLLQWDAGGVAIRTPRTRAVPLLQRGLTELVPCERSALVRHAFDVRALHLLQIEADKFLRQGRHRGHAAQPRRPRSGGVHAVLEAGSSTSRSTSRIAKG